MKIKNLFNKYAITFLTTIACMALNIDSWIFGGEYAPPKELLNNNSNN